MIDLFAEALAWALFVLIVCGLFALALGFEFGVVVVLLIIAYFVGVLVVMYKD